MQIKCKRNNKRRIRQIIWNEFEQRSVMKLPQSGEVKGRTS